MQEMDSCAEDGQLCRRWTAMQEMDSCAGDGQLCRRWSAVQEMVSCVGDDQPAGFSAIAAPATLTALRNTGRLNRLSLAG